MVIRTAAPTDEISASARSLWESLLDALPRLGVAFVIVFVGWGFGRGVRWVMRTRLQRSRTPSFANVMSKLTSWLVVIVSVLLAAAVTFPSVKPVDLLAGLGFFSIAVGFAFQDILENTLAGVLLLFRQPFRSGDQIKVVDQSGTVTEINIRETRITTFDGESVIIPNRDVYKNVILVHTHHDLHRLQFDIGIAYDNDAEQATRAIVEALSTVAGVEHDPPPEALVHELGVSTVNIRAMLWTRLASPRNRSPFSTPRSRPSSLASTATASRCPPTSSPSKQPRAFAPRSTATRRSPRPAISARMTQAAPGRGDEPAD